MTCTIDDFCVVCGLRGESISKCAADCYAHGGMIPCTLDCTLKFEDVSFSTNETVRSLVVSIMPDADKFNDYSAVIAILAMAEKIGDAKRIS